MCLFELLNLAIIWLFELLVLFLECLEGLCSGGQLGGDLLWLLGWFLFLLRKPLYLFCELLDGGLFCLELLGDGLELLSVLLLLELSGGLSCID